MIKKYLQKLAALACCSCDRLLEDIPGECLQICEIENQSVFLVPEACLEEPLEQTDEKVIDISQKVGYENEKHFMKTFKSMCGVSPSEYRRNMQLGR